MMINMKKKGALMRNEIIAKLINDHSYSEDLAEREADLITSSLRFAPCLAQNINEWLKGEAISDVFVGRWCVRNVLTVRGRKAVLDHPGDTEILQAIYSILMYAADPAIGKTLIYSIRR
jgi:hypothetical protein